MLHIILMILKLIGFVILALLGLILLIILTTLLVPIRYRIAVEHGEVFYAKGRVHWLLHIIHAEVSYVEDKLHIIVRLFGIVIYDNLKPKEPKARKRKSAKLNTGTHPIKRSKSGKTQYAKRIKDNKTKADSNILIETPTTNPKVSKIQQESYDSIGSSTSDDRFELSNIEDTENIIVPEKKEPEISFANRKNNKTDENRKDDNSRKEIPLETEQQTSEKKKSFFQKLSERFHEFKEKLISGIKNFIEKIRNLFTTVKTFQHKGNLIYEFIRNEMNRQGFSVTFTSLKKMLKHILPTKLKSEIVFGTGDPCSTGQLLGVLGFLYGFYGDKIRITPDFENSRLEGKHDARGRIRLVTILIIVVKLILDKRFKQLKTNATLLKEAL